MFVFIITDEEKDRTEEVKGFGLMKDEDPAVKSEEIFFNMNNR